MTTKTLAGPKIKTALPGPNAKRVLAGDEKYLSPSYTRSYPLVAKHGRGIVVDRRGRQRVLRFLRRHRRDFDRALPSRCGGRHPEAGGRTDPHVGHGFLLREHGHAGGAAVEDRAHARAAPDLLRQLRHGSGGSRAEAGALSHQAPERDRLLRRVPRTHHGRALADRVEAAAEAPFRLRWFRA